MADISEVIEKKVGEQLPKGVRLVFMVGYGLKWGINQKKHFPGWR